MGFENLGKKIIIGATTLLAGAAAKGQDINVNTMAHQASNKQKIEYATNIPEMGNDNDEGKSGLIFWTSESPKTKEGGITPTGKSNSFEYSGLTEEDAIKIADVLATKYGFDKTNNLAFQTALYKYVNEYNHEMMKEAIKDLGPAEAGLDADGNLKPDGILGRRTFYIMDKLYKTILVEEIIPQKNLENKRDVFEVGGYEKVILLADKSPSMEAHKKGLVDSLSKVEIDIPTYVVGYTNKTDTVFTAKNLTGAAKIIENMPSVNEDEELAIDETIQTLKNIEKDGKKGIMFIVTDEELQHVSQPKLDTLTKLSQDKNIKLMFTVMIGEKTYQRDIDQIKEAYAEKYNEAEHIKEIETTQQQVSTFTKILQRQKSELSAGNNRDYLKRLQKDIAETQMGLDNHREHLKRLYEVNISNFAEITAKTKPTLVGKDFTKKSNTVGLTGADISKNK